MFINFSLPDSRDLTAAIDYAGDTYVQIGEMYAKQPEKDIDPTHDLLYEYKGTLSVFPDVLKVHEVRSTNGLLTYKNYKKNSVLHMGPSYSQSIKVCWTSLFVFEHVNTSK